jgi:dihydroneopterin aldolase
VGRGTYRPDLLDLATVARDVISVDGLELDCVVGLYPKERNRLQPLRMDIELDCDTERAAESGKLSLSIDYEAIVSQLVFLLQSCRFKLLETAAHVLARHLLAPPGPGERRAQVEGVRLRLSKPGALYGRAVPTLKIARTAEWVKLRTDPRPFGSVDIIDESADAGIYRLNVAPGQEIPLHIHQRMQESEMVLSDGLLCQGRPARRGSVRRWPLRAPHTYSNPTEHYQTVLCVNTPPFADDDEICVEGEPAHVHPEPGWLGG